MSPNAKEANPTEKSAQPLLFRPYKLGNVTLKNRICIAPMCMYSAEDGHVSEWHRVHLGARAIGGAGMVMMEATAVEARGRISPACTGIYKDEHIPALKKITDFIKSQNSVPAIQLAHSGRKGSTYVPWQAKGINIKPEEGGWETIAPSAIPFGDEQVPKEATIEDIREIVMSFAEAARRSLAAGFQAIELHFAHGYLAHSFMSQYSNKRTDEYGGDFEGRTRFVFDVIRAVKAVLPVDYPLMVRISCDDFLLAGEGWDMNDSVRFGVIAKQLGVHLIDCSSGGNVARFARTIVYNDLDQVAMSGRIQAEAGIATGAVGGIVSSAWAEEILQQDKASLIFIGRVSLDDPNWPLRAAYDLGAEVDTPNPYRWSIAPGPWRRETLEKQNAQQLEAYRKAKSNV